jgi:hypothetical protein
MAASTTHLHEFSATNTGYVCNLCGATMTDAEIKASPLIAGVPLSVALHDKFKKNHG